VQERGGSTARQPAQAGQRKYSIARASGSVYEWGLAAGQESLLFSVSWNPVLSRSLNFSESLVFFGSFAKFMKSESSGFHDHCAWTGCKLVTEWWDNCIVYSLLCIFTIINIIIIISSSSSISFVALLNCLYLNP